VGSKGAFVSRDGLSLGAAAGCFAGPELDTPF
jgi:hypothetical protein